MNFLVDENLSPSLAVALAKSGHDALHTRATKPSTILVRELLTLRPEDLAEVILRHLDLIEEHLDAGAIIAFGPRGIRVRALPLR